MSFVYYIHKNLPSENKDLSGGARVVKIPDKFKNLKMQEVDGPFSDISVLKKQSNIFKELIRTDPKRAQIIFKEKYLLEIEKFIFVPLNKNLPFEKIIYKLMQHSQNGIINKDDVLGVHLFNSMNAHRIKIIRVTKKENSKGIWEAKIGALNMRNGKWIVKEKPTTFFPKEWDLQKLIDECEPAFNNKKEISKNIWVGYTKDKIPVRFIFSESNELKTVYPIFD